MRKRNYAKEWKDWRLKHDMSQVMMARALGLGRKTVQEIEWGKHQPSFTSRQRFKALKERHERERRCQMP